MQLTSFLRELISEESRFQLLYKKLVDTPADNKPKLGQPKQMKSEKGIMSFETLKNIIAIDPTSVFPSEYNINLGTEFSEFPRLLSSRIEFISPASPDEVENKVKVGKYTNWLIKQYLKKPEDDENTTEEYQRLFLEDNVSISKSIQKFERYKSQLPIEDRNIDKFNINTLSSVMDRLVIMVKNKEKSAEALSPSNYSHPGAEKIFTTPNWTVLKISDNPQGMKAAEFLGGCHQDERGETNWCTSIENSSNYKTYIKQGPLYIILPNNDNGKVGQISGLPVERYQFHFPSNQFKDRKNGNINLVEYFNGKFSDLKDFFKTEFLKAYVQPKSNKISITYDGGGHDAMGRFIAIYGLQDIIDSVPSDISYFKFKNISGGKITIDLENIIGKWTEIDNLTLDNCIDTLPNEIMNLKNLEHLNLRNNKSLVQIPPIEKLPNLTFVSLRNTGVLDNLSESFKKVFETEANGDFLKAD